ncbi:glomulin [Zophobas morio]|uniref:glomulin n=1 Tax=Zophobas morio TaxID=2755281 RepID=UPI0030835658
MTSELGDNNFADTISILLNEGNTVQALTLFTDNRNSEEVYNNSWDLVPIVSKFLSEESEDNNVGVFKCCQKIIDIIAEQAKPEEVLLQFIEELELAKDDTKFLALLKPLKTVLVRVPDKRITSLGWCFNAIKHYLETLETPEDLNLTGDERLLLDSSESVRRINTLYENLVIFCETFVAELASDDKCSNVCERKQVVRKFLVELLGKPLAFLDMDVLKNTKPQARIIAEDLIEKFFSLSSDPFLFLEMRDGDLGSDLFKPNNLSLGVFYYLILSQEVCIKDAPKVYSLVYILHNSLNLVNFLLSQTSQLVLEKSVHLAAALLKNINQQELSYLLLDSEVHSKFCKTLSNVIIHNESQEIRKTSLGVLHKYLWSFEHQGRFLIIINLMRHLTHSGLKGNLIMQYKAMLSEEIKNGNLKNLSKYYKEHKLFDLLDEFTLLKNREETDLVDNSDQIVSTLNFLRYLVIVDKTGETGIDCYLDILDEGYFKSLKIGITMAKEHYRLKIKEEEESARSNKEKSDCEVSVTVLGKNLAEIPTEKKIEIMNLSLTTLDVVDSLLSRVMECINLKKNNVYV